MRPKTPDDVFGGGGLFANLGSHEQKTRQLQNQRKKEYNDILRGGLKNGRTELNDGLAPTVGKNVTDNQKIERRYDGAAAASGDSNNSDKRYVSVSAPDFQKGPQLAKQGLFYLKPN